MYYISVEEPPWLFSESTSPLSSACCTPCAPRSTYIQTTLLLPPERRRGECGYPRQGCVRLSGPGSLRLPKMPCVIFRINSNDAAGAGSVNAPQARIELDYIGAWRKWKMSDGFVLIQRKHGHGSALSTEQKGAVTFRVERHSMIEFTALNRIATHDRIRRRIDFSDLVCAAQVHVNFASN